jgi:UDP-3-O-[3-hydroxymyristoyl] glucosamine N-acyltransferase
VATLKQLAEFLGAEIVGSAAGELVRVASAAQADVSAVVFAESEAALAAALASAAGAVLTREQLYRAVAKPDGKAVLLVREPRLGFARAAEFLRRTNAPAGGAPRVHETAVLGERVQLGPGVQVGPYVVLGRGVILGAQVEIGAGCILGDNVRIGAHSKLFARVTIYAGATLGARVVVHSGAVLGADGFGYVRDPESGAYTQFPQRGTLVLEDDVEVGANTTIDRGALQETRIGRGTKLDNLVHIGHNVTVGCDVVIAAQTGISGSSTIGDHAIVGGQVGIGDHVSIGSGVILGSKSGVPSHKKIFGAGGVFWGVPARPLRQYLKELATLAKLARGEDARAGDED